MSSNGNKVQFYWSRDMILKSMKTFMLDWMIDQIPKHFMDRINAIKTVMSNDDLFLMIDFTILWSSDDLQIAVLKQFRKIFEELIFYPSLPQAIGLNGCINIKSRPKRHPDGKSGPLQMDREWVISIGLSLFEQFFLQATDFPQCSKYVCLYEADKFARKLKYPQLISFDQVSLETILQELSNTAVPKLKQFVQDDQNITRDMDDLQKLQDDLFENTDFWLIPEYNYVLDEELKKFSKFSNKQWNGLYYCKVFVSEYFNLLSNVSPFDNGVKTVETREIKHESFLNLYHNFGKLKAFKNDVLRNSMQFFDDMNEGKKFFDEHFRTSDSLLMMTKDDVSSFMAQHMKEIEDPYVDGFSQTLEPTHKKPTGISMFFPFKSSDNSLCMEQSQAWNDWEYKLLKFNFTVNNFETGRFEEIRAFIEKVIDGLGGHVEKSTAVPFDYIKKLSDEWNEITKPYFPGKDYPHFICPSESYSKQEMIHQLKCTLSGHLYPVLAEGYADYQSLEQSEASFEKFKHLSMLSTFPKAAIQYHKMGMCCYLDTNRCCAVDLIIDPEMKKSEIRCDVPMTSKIVESIQKVHGIESDKPKIAEVPKLTGLRRGFFNKPISEEAASQETQKSAEKPSGLKRGFLNKKETTASAVTRLEKVENDSKLSSTGDSIPGVHLLNALQQILFPATFKRLPPGLLSELKRPNFNMTICNIETNMRRLAQYLQPVDEHMYCCSEDDMVEMAKSLVISHGIIRTYPGMGITITNIERGKKGIATVKKSMVPSMMYHACQQHFERKIIKNLYKFEFEKMAHDIKNNETVEVKMSDLADVYKEMSKNIPKPDEKEIKNFWKKHSKQPIETAITSVVAHIFKGYDTYPYKEGFAEELLKLVMESKDQLEELKNFFQQFCAVKLIAKKMIECLPVIYTNSFWKVPDKSIPQPKFYLRVVKPRDCAPDGIHERAFAFCREVETWTMMIMKNANRFKKKIHVKDWLEKDTPKIFNYLYSKEIEAKLNEKCPIRKVKFYCQETFKYGYDTCPPFMSPINTRCKTAEVILRDLFNHLNYELNIFRSIKEEHFKDLHAYIDKFCKEFELHRNSKFCISYDHFIMFVNENRPRLLAMMDQDVQKMTFLDDESYDGETLKSLLMSNAKPGLLRGYELAVTCAAENQFSDTTDCVNLADNILFCSFVVEYPQLCFLMHNQEQCSLYWNDCLLRIHAQSGPYCDFAKNNCSCPSFESRYALLLTESLPMKKSKKPKSVKKTDSVEKVEESRRSSEEVKGKTGREGSFSNVPEIVEVPEVKAPEVMLRRKSATPIEKKDVVLYNYNLIKKCLEFLCDAPTFQKLHQKLRKIFKQPEKWMKFEEVSKLFETFSGVSGSSLDTILHGIQQLRQLPVAPVLFEIGTERIDFKNPNRHKMSKEDRRTCRLKQDLLKCLPIPDNFYQKDNGIFKFLMEHKLDVLARTIERCEVVMLKCPKLDLEILMEDLKKKIKKNRKEQAIMFVEKHRKQIDELETDDKKIDYMITISSATDKIPVCYQNEMLNLLKTFKNNNNREQWMWNLLQTKMNAEKFVEFRKIHQEQFDKLATNDAKMDYLISILSGTKLNNLIDSLKNKKSQWIDIVLFKIHKAERAAETLCEVDIYGITRKFDKDTLEHIPVVRAVGNKPLFFVDELRMGFEVAHRLRNDGVELDETNLPKDDHNYCDSFCYVNKEQLNIISKNEGFYELPFELMNSDQVNLKTDALIPVWSPNNTPCVEAKVVLKQVLKNLTSEKLFSRIRSTDLNKLSNYVEHLCHYFKPKIFMTFCLDYHKSMELIDDKLAKFGDLKSAVQTNHKSKTDIKKVIENESKKRVFPSFELMLSSLLADYESLPTNDTLAEIVDNADLRTFMFEYSQMAVIYHNQKLCSVTGKKPFCSISLIEGDNLGYEISPKCNIPNTGHVEGFKKMMKARNMTRLAGAIEKNFIAENLEEKDENVTSTEVEDSEAMNDEVLCEPSQASEEVGSSYDSFDDDMEAISDGKLESSSSEESDHEETVGEEESTEEKIEPSSSLASDHEEVEEEGSIIIDLKPKTDNVVSIELFDPASFIESSSGTFIVDNSGFNKAEPSTSQNPNPFSSNFDFSQMFAPVYGYKPSKPTNFSNQPSTSNSSKKSTLPDRRTHRSPAHRTKPTSSFKLGDYIPKSEETLHQKIQRLERENEQLKWQMIHMTVDRDEWKKKYENLLSTKDEKEESMKMKKICCICKDEMLSGRRPFNCIQCNAEVHYECYEKCETASCPLCRKTWADRVDFPKL